MLSEFRCKKCQARFLAGLRKAEDGPMKYCICCGSSTLEYVGDEEDLVVKLRKVIESYESMMKNPPIVHHDPFTEARAARADLEARTLKKDAPFIPIVEG